MIATYMARITGYRLFLPISGAVFYYLSDCFALPIIFDRMPSSVLHLLLHGANQYNCAFPSVQQAQSQTKA